MTICHFQLFFQCHIKKILLKTGCHIPLYVHDKHIKFYVILSEIFVVIKLS